MRGGLQVILTAEHYIHSATRAARSHNLIPGFDWFLDYAFDGLMSFSFSGLISLNIFPCFKFNDLATRVAIIPIVELGA